MALVKTDGIAFVQSLQPHALAFALRTGLHLLQGPIANFAVLVGGQQVQVLQLQAPIVLRCHR